jgi:hypothetical protein
MRDHYLDYRLRKLLLRRVQPVSIEAVVSWRRSFAMSQFTIWLEHVCDVTTAVVNASAMKAVPIVSNTPRMIPNRRFIAAALQSSDLELVNAMPQLEFLLAHCGS